MIVREHLTNEEVAALTYALEKTRVDDIPPRMAAVIIELTRFFQGEYEVRGLQAQGYGF